MNRISSIEWSWSNHSTANGSRSATVASGTRYVTDADGSEDPTWDEAERAVATAGRVLAAVRAYLDEAG